jgi:hypothetical protein
VSPVFSPALEILDEVQQSNAVNPLEDFCAPERMHSFHSPGGALEQSNKYNQIVFMFLIG